MNTYLGFDYGTTNIAMGIITEGECKSYFRLLNKPREPYWMHQQVKHFLKYFEDDFPRESQIKQPSIAYIESAFKGPNSKTFQDMTRVAHSIHILLASWGIECHYIDNNIWRKILFGKGNTKKEEAQEWAYEKWPFLLEYKKSERGHRADALCISEAGRLNWERKDT
jgi:Holliday junction resolvasome RuvABC endonuclease subunit